MKAYFDRNVFGDLSKGRSGDMALLHTAVEGKKLTVLLSTTVLEETVPLLKHSANTLRQELEVIFSLVDRRKIIKSPNQLLKEAVQSYAHRRRLPEMLTKTPRILEKFLVRGEATVDLKRFMERTVAQGSKFGEGLTEAFKQLRSAGKALNVGQPDNFQQVWNSHASDFAGWLASQHDVHSKCLDRGIEGLLEIRAVKLYTIYCAALVWSKWFGEQNTPGQVRASERGDFFHSVQAATADVFVTQDARLERWLKQVPIRDLEIIDLDQLLERLRGARPPRRV